MPETRNVTTEDYDPRSRFVLYRLCDCTSCGGSGRKPPVAFPDPLTGRTEYRVKGPKCPDCRGEGRIRQEVASCESPEAVGVALVTLGREKEWEGCAFGLLDRMPPCERCAGYGTVARSLTPYAEFGAGFPIATNEPCPVCDGSGVKPTGTWLILPWSPSARNVTDAARTLAKSKKRS